MYVCHLVVKSELGHRMSPIILKIFWGSIPPDHPSGGGPEGPPGALVGTNF